VCVCARVCVPVKYACSLHRIRSRVVGKFGSFVQSAEGVVDDIRQMSTIQRITRIT